MAHKDFGRVGFVLGGGGCAEGLPQIVQINQFFKAGIRPDYIICESVGAWNALDLDNALSIWTENFYSPWTIYDLNPDIEFVIDKVLRAIPKSPFHHHDSWRELWRDFEAQYHNIKQVLSLVFRIVNSIPSLPGDARPSPEAFSPFWQVLVKELRDTGLSEIKNIFNPAPLINTLRKILDLKKTLEQDATLHILACSGIEEHIFSAGKTLPSEFLARMQYPLHEVSSEEQLFTAAMASSALRPLFSPVNIGGAYYWDAGTLNPYPVQCAIDAGCDTVFAFVKNYWTFDSDLDANILESFIEENDKLTRKIFINTNKEIMRRQDGRVKIHIILPQPLHPDLRLLWITPEAVEHTLKIEKEATQNWLKENLNIGLDSD